MGEERVKGITDGDGYQRRLREGGETTTWKLGTARHEDLQSSLCRGHPLGEQTSAMSGYLYLQARIMSQYRRHDALVMLATGTSITAEPGITSAVGRDERIPCPAFWSGSHWKSGTIPSTGEAVILVLTPKLTLLSSSLPSPRDGRLADTYPRQPDTLTHHVYPILWVMRLNDGHQGFPTHRVGLAASRGKGAVYINTSISASLSFLIETDERTTWAISPPLTEHPSYACPL